METDAPTRKASPSPLSREEQKPQPQQSSSRRKRQKGDDDLFSDLFSSFVPARPLPVLAHRPPGMVPPLLRPGERRRHGRARGCAERRRSRRGLFFCRPSLSSAAAVGRRARAAAAARAAAVGRVRVAGELARRGPDALDRVRVRDELLRGPAAVAGAGGGVWCRGRGGPRGRRDRRPRGASSPRSSRNSGSLPPSRPPPLLPPCGTLPPSSSRPSPPYLS